MPTDDPLGALELLRDAACDHVISASTKIRGTAFEWRNWVAEDLQDRYHYPLTADIGIIATRCAGMLDRYIGHTRQDRAALSRNFIYTVGALLATDVQGFKDLHVIRPDKVASFQPEISYWALIDIHKEDVRVNPTVVKYCLYSCPEDPEKAVQQYLKRVDDCYNNLIPKLRESFGYTGELPDAMVRKVCLTSADIYEYRINQWFAQSFLLHRELADKQPRLTMTTASARYINNVRSQIQSSQVHIAENSLSLNECTLNYLAKLRKMYQTDEIRVGPNPGVVMSAKILRVAMETTLMALPEYVPEDVRQAANFIDYSTRHYSRIHPEDPIDTDIITLVELGLAYIVDKRSLQRQGLYNPHIIARFHDDAIFSKLCKQHRQLPFFIIKTALMKNPKKPEVWLEKFMETRNVILDYVHRKAGLDLEIELANFIAAQNPADINNYVETFLNRYQRLLTEWEDDDGVESWMLRRAALMSPKDPARGVRYMRALSRKGVYRDSLDAPRGSGTNLTRYDRMSSSMIADPLDIYISQEEKDNTPNAQILQLLAPLSSVERAAVAHVFGFDFPNTPFLSSDQLERELGTDDISAYIMDRIRSLGIRD